MRDESERLRPYRHIFLSGLYASLAFITPVLIVLYFVTVPNGPWPAVLVGQLVATVVVSVASSAFFRVGIWVSPTGIRERGFFGRATSVSIDQVDSIVRARMFEGGDTNTVPQLFVCDAAGNVLVRMRGQFWSPESMDRVVTVLDVPVRVLDDTLSTSDMRVEFPRMLYWFERHPVLAALAFSGAIAVAGLLLVGILVLSGVGLSF